MRAKAMDLPPELTARVARAVADPGPSPGAVYMDEADYAEAVQNILAQAPAGDLWLFAYGSLLWKPACATLESRTALVRGWHRSFCFRVARFRGSPDRPGLMMALDRGGQCRGVIQRIARADAEASLHALLRREVMIKPSINVPRWLPVETRDGRLRALGFVVNRSHLYYAGRLPPDETAATIAAAAGHWGSCADYLRETVAHLEALGIRDRNLWALQRMVAERIRAQTSAAAE